MAQEVKKAKVCSSTFCCNSTAVGAGDSDGGDFVSCQKCGVWIHKICFGLSGDLLEIFESRGEEFPFTVLCSGCRGFTEKSDDKVILNHFSCEDSKTRKNPFDIDCIVQVILEHLNLQDLVNIRLVNKLCNETASRLLSKDSRQEQIKSYDVKRKNDLEKCLQCMRDSGQKKLFRQLEFNSFSDEDEDLMRDLHIFNEMVKIAKPTNVSISIYNSPNFKLTHLTALSSLLTNVSINVVKLRLGLPLSNFDSTNFCMPKFSKLKELAIYDDNIQGNSKLMKFIIQKSPKLMNLTLDPCGSNCEIDDYVNNGDNCILSEESFVNLQQLKLYETKFNFELFLNQMTLKTLTLHPSEINYYNLDFEKLQTFLTSQNGSLETLEIYFMIVDFDEIDDIEDVENAQMDLPRLKNVTAFSLAFKFEDANKLCNTNEEIWPVKPIDLSAKLPNLKKITIKYCQSWALSFDQERNYPHVTELVLNKWTDGNLAKLVQLFPQVDFLNLKKFSYSINRSEKVYTRLENLGEWPESLKRIEITFKYFHLENFDFENLVCLTNLKSIKISQPQEKNLDRVIIPNHFIYPDFKPLFKIPALSQLVIKNFKISRGIIEELREKFPSLDYSFYPK